MIQFYANRKSWTYTATILAVAASPLLLWPTPACGSTLVEAHLATVTDVNVKVTGGLLYEPVPGLDREAFERGIREAAEHQLAKCAIPVSDSSSQHLSLSFHKTIAHRDSSDLLVFRFDLELREPAALARPLPKAAEPELFVTSWRSWDIVIVRAEESLDALLESVEYEVLVFAQGVAAARAEYLSEAAIADIPQCFD
jgi:hypothetical protein